MDTVDKKEWEKSEILTRAILEVEDFFLHEKEGKLYDFLVDVIEKPLIENLLVKTEGNQLKAAKILGINRNTLHAKIRKLGIDVGYYKNERRVR